MADSSSQLINELRRQLDKNGEVDINDVVRYSLIVMVEVLTRLDTMEENDAARGGQLAKLVERHDRYPSILYLWSIKPKRVLAAVLLLGVIYTIVFSPVNFAENRDVIKSFLIALF